MINDLLNIERTLAEMGVVLEDQYHTKLPIVPKGRYLMLRINARGRLSSVTVFDDPNWRYYSVNKNNSGLSIKISSSEPKTNIRKLGAGLNATIALGDMFQPNKGLVPLHRLIESLRKVEPEVLWNDLLLKYHDVKNLKNFYVAFENHIDEDYMVQCKHTHDAINKGLFRLDSKVKSDSKDALGLPNPIDDSFQHKIESPRLVVPVYSRNANNNCYLRYGKTDLELFPLGPESRNRVARILNAVLTKDAGQKVGTSAEFRFKRSDSDKNSINLIAISTMLADDLLLADQSFMLDEWRAGSQKHLQKLIYNNPPAEALSNGQIVLLRRPDNGPWNIEYRREFSSSELKNMFLDWDAGVDFFNNCQLPYKFFLNVPSIFSLTKAMMARYSKQGSSFRTTNVPVWTLSDSFEFFAGNPVAVERLTLLLAKFTVPTFLQCTALNTDKAVKLPWQLQLVFAITGILFRKASIMPEDLDNSPYYSMGRMFHEADRIHRAYFKERGADPPAMLIGQRYVRMAYDSPQLALGSFHKNFQIYLTWAETKRKARGQYQPIKANSYLAMVSKVGADITPTMTPIQRIQLALGYAYRRPQSQSSESMT